MEQSILKSVRSKIEVLSDDDSFDSDLIDHINSVFMILTQLGVGPSEGFYIQDEKATWNDFIPQPEKGAFLQGVKTYVYQKTRLVFDPPQNSSLLAALKDSIAEFEWRLNHDAELRSIDKGGDN